MKLLITFNYFEGEFLLKNSKILEETTIFKDKKQKSKLYKIEMYGNICYFALLGMTHIFAMPSLQKILQHNDISEIMVFGSAGSSPQNIGKLVLINTHKYSSDFLDKYFLVNSKIPKWIKNSPKLEIFTSISVNEVNQSNKNDNEKYCFDMETSEIAYLLKLNKIEASYFRIVTDSGYSNFNEIKNIYNSKTPILLNYIEKFLKH